MNDHPTITRFDDCWQLRLDTPEAVHRDIAAQLEAGLDQARRTHLFGGRYENLYLPLDRVPALTPVLDAIVTAAAGILDVEPAHVRYGFWFNRMAPGDTTTRHNHDDLDERLSGTYYIRTAPGCGDLVLHGRQGATRISAEEGLCVLFRPDLDHEVTRNDSRTIRLSIGINFTVDGDSGRH